MSKRKALVSSSRLRIDPVGNRDYRHIVKISQSLAECRHEWNLVAEATKVLSQNSRALSPLPPIYPQDSSPWDVNYQVDTDDDEWLIDVSSKGWNSVLQLEEVLQADQLINRILKTHSWSNEENIVSETSSISKICCSIDTKTLMKVHGEIEDSVVIKKGRSSYNDPKGNKVSN